VGEVWGGFSTHMFYKPQAGGHTGLSIPLASCVPDAVDGLVLRIYILAHFSRGLIEIPSSALTSLAPTLPSHHSQVFEVLSRQFVSRRMYGISNPHLARLASSFAAVGHQDEALSRTLARLASGRIDSLSTPELATLAWALASLEMHSSVLMRAATAAAVGHLEELSALQVANLQVGQTLPPPSHAY